MYWGAWRILEWQHRVVMTGQRRTEHKEVWEDKGTTACKEALSCRPGTGQGKGSNCTHTYYRLLLF
jgi:hypothetical protein